uniref:ORF_05R n=1 Tax=Human herpesvirus 1 (strain R15) TaxID=36345 RepID=Q6VB57_HHV1R|nr:ORF_05R [Human alphaherpesvirus 1 strain R-15]
MAGRAERNRPRGHGGCLGVYWHRGLKGGNRIADVRKSGPFAANGDQRVSFLRTTARRCGLLVWDLGHAHTRTTRTPHRMGRRKGAWGSWVGFVQSNQGPQPAHTIALPSVCPGQYHAVLVFVPAEQGLQGVVGGRGERGPRHGPLGQKPSRHGPRFSHPRVWGLDGDKSYPEPDFLGVFEKRHTQIRRAYHPQVVEARGAGLVSVQQSEARHGVHDLGALQGAVLRKQARGGVWGAATGPSAHDRAGGFG